MEEKLVIAQTRQNGGQDDVSSQESPTVGGKNGDKSAYPGKLKNQDTASRCFSVKSAYLECTRPCLASSHPLPNQPHPLRKAGQWFLCPPSGKVGAVLVVMCIFGLWWSSALAIVGKEALPGGNVFSMSVVFVGAWCGGYVIKHTPFPPLLGMLIMGGVLGNVPTFNFARQLSPVWASTARNMALTVILIRAGLGLDPVALKRLSLVVPRLAFCPSLVEVLTDGLLAKFILNLPWTWAFMLAFVLSVVSPAVVVPSMLTLSEQGYGLNKGIPTLVIAACTMDAVLAITGFGVLLGISFSEGNIVWTVVKAPLEVLAGIAFGCVGGVIMWYLPQRSSKNLVLFRSLMLLGSGLLAIFGSKAIKWSGSGPLGCLSVAFVSAHGWRQEYRDTSLKNPVEDVMGVLWMVFQPLLFGLIGVAVDISALDGDTVGLGLVVIVLGLSMRMVMAFVTVLGTQLNLRERFFIPLAWSPKATVQAAIGAVAYDTAVEKGALDLIPLGKQVLTLAVLAILLTAPIGSLLIALTGPRLLHHSERHADKRNDRPSLTDFSDPSDSGDQVISPSPDSTPLTAKENDPS